MKAKKFFFFFLSVAIIIDFVVILEIPRTNLMENKWILMGAPILLLLIAATIVDDVRSAVICASIASLAVMILLFLWIGIPADVGQVVIPFGVSFLISFFLAHMLRERFNKKGIFPN